MEFSQPMASQSVQNIVKAGDELSFLGNSKRLKTSSNSFKFIPSDTIGVSKVVATRTGILEASQQDQTKSKSGKKSQKVQIDVVPLHATRYMPSVDDIIIGTVV